MRLVMKRLVSMARVPTRVRVTEPLVTNSEEMPLLILILRRCRTGIQLLSSLQEYCVHRRKPSPNM